MIKLYVALEGDLEEVTDALRSGLGLGLARGGARRLRLLKLTRLTALTTLTTLTRLTIRAGASVNTYYLPPPTMYR